MKTEEDENSLGLQMIGKFDLELRNYDIFLSTVKMSVFCAPIVYASYFH